MKKIFLIFLFLCSALAQAQTGGWHKKHFLPNSLVSVCRDIIETSLGNYIALGFTYDTINGNNSNRLTLIGLDVNGNVTWQKNYGNQKFEYLDNILCNRNILKGNNCFYYYSAVLDSNNKYGSVLVKFDFNGDSLWQKTYYSGSNGVNLYVNGANFSVDGGILLTGQMVDFNLNKEPILILKTNIDGSELWRKEIQSTNSINPVHDGRRIVQDSSTKKIIIAGYQRIGTDTHSSILITDSLGNKIIQMGYSGSFGGTFSDLIQTKDKNFVAVGGKYQGNPKGGYDRTKGQAVKFNINGGMIWQREYDTLSISNNNGTINELPDENLIIGGCLDTMFNYDLDISIRLRIIKLSSNGNLIWKKYYGSATSETASEFIRSLSFTSDYGFLVATEMVFLPSPRPYNIRKIDSTGCDTAALYCQSVGMEEIGYSKSSFSVHPNPASSNLCIDSELPVNSEIEVFNTFGQSVIRMTFSNTINISFLPAGIYHLRVRSGDRTVYSKFVKE